MTFVLRRTRCTILYFLQQQWNTLYITTFSFRSDCLCKPIIWHDLQYTLNNRYEIDKPNDGRKAETAIYNRGVITNVINWFPDSRGSYARAIQPSRIRAQSRSDWPQLVQIRDFFQIKNPRICPIWANLTHLGPKSDHMGAISPWALCMKTQHASIHNHWRCIHIK